MAEVSTSNKLEKIRSFCAKHGGGIVTNYIQDILQNAAGFIPDSVMSFIDIIWDIVNKLENTSDTNSRRELMICVIRLLGGIFSIVGIGIPGFSFAREITSLTVFFLKTIFRLVDLNLLVHQSSINTNDPVDHEIAGLVEKLKRVEIFITEVYHEEHVDESTLQGLISNVDMHIGIYELGNLKSRIHHLCFKGREELKTCLHFLTLFVRISTIRHSLLFRMMECLFTKQYSIKTVESWRRCIEKERKDNNEFLQFFTLPSLEDVRVVAAFDPSEHTELAAYLADIGVELRDLKKEVDGRIFMIQPYRDDTRLLARPILSFSSVCAETVPLDNDNIHVKFKFTAIDNTFNLFHIQSPQSLKYLHLDTNASCRHGKYPDTPEAAQWRLIEVKLIPEDKRSAPSFVLCTKMWPERLLCVKMAFFRRTIGLDGNIKPNPDAVFKVSTTKLLG